MFSSSTEIEKSDVMITGVFISGDARHGTLDKDISKLGFVESLVVTSSLKTSLSLLSIRGTNRLHENADS